MALGDGDTWDETNPTNSTSAVQIDDYNRDLRKGFRSRLALEHEMPASQSATSEGGRHKYISFQSQASLPTAAISGTQIGGLYVKTQNLFYVNTASDEVQIVAGTAVGDGKILANSTDAAAGYLVDKLDSTFLTISGTNLIFATSAITYYRYTSNAASTQLNARSLIMCFGRIASLGGGASTSITNLPFSDATSFSIALTPDTNIGNESVKIVSKAAATVAVKNSSLNLGNIDWVMIGE